jgi:hypothetical protein
LLQPLLLNAANLLNDDRLLPLLAASETRTVPTLQPTAANAAKIFAAPISTFFCDFHSSLKKVAALAASNLKPLSRLALGMLPQVLQRMLQTKSGSIHLAAFSSQQRFSTGLLCDSQPTKKEGVTPPLWKPLTSILSAAIAQLPAPVLLQFPPQ